MYIDEPVQVDLSAGGVPLSFRWRGISYAIVSAPEPWLSRRVWWRGSDRVTRGQTPPLDVPTWKRAIRGADQEIEAANYELEQGR